MQKRISKILSTRFLLLKVLFALFVLIPAISKGVELSDSARISLLTCAPGEELYSAFGHNGIRVTDFKENWDVVFNYGTFDDNQPGFYFNFVKGRMIYSVSYDSYPDFISEYIDSKRGVVEQELRLTAEDKQKIFKILYTNALPENRNYPYDFFWDNCATRPRDVFEKVLGNRLQYRYDNCGFEQNKTMHDMLRLYVHDRPWVDLGFDLILGLPCEVPATPRNQTFLPDYLAKLFACATVDGQPFVTSTKTVVDAPLPKLTTAVLPSHVTAFIMLVGLALIFWERRTKKHYYIFDFVLFLIAGFWGLTFLLTWAFTTHYSLPKNLNMLWLIPTHFFVAFFLLKKKKPYWLNYYFIGTYVLMIILLAVWKVNPQPYNIAFAPLIILLGARAFTIHRDIYK